MEQSVINASVAVTLLEQRPEKNSGSERDSNPRPLRCQCSALPTELSKPHESGRMRVSPLNVDVILGPSIVGWKLILSISSNCVLMVINASAAVTLLEQRPEKKFRLWAGFEPTTSAMPVQCSPNWAIKATWEWSHAGWPFKRPHLKG